MTKNKTERMDSHIAIRRVIERIPGVNASVTTETIEEALSAAGYEVVPTSVVAERVRYLGAIQEHMAYRHVFTYRRDMYDKHLWSVLDAR